MFFSFALREAVHGVIGLFGWSMSRCRRSMRQTETAGHQ
jgi:hypothetical protein